MAEPTVRFAETPAQFLARTYQPEDKRNSTQQAFTMYFACAISGVSSAILWNHSARLRQFFGFYPTRFIIPSMIATTAISDKVVANYSRRSYYGMDRHDRDWRNMPTGV